MTHGFMEQEWLDLCRRLQTSAQYLGGDQRDRTQDFEQQAASFSSRVGPANYAELLTRVAEAAALAKSWQQNRNDGATVDVKQVSVQEHVNTSDEIVDEVGNDSFPASDPPAWTTAAMS